MKTKIDGVIRLTRFKEYLFFVIITTFLGAMAANGHFGWRLVGVLVANWLAVAFAFMINDVEDAPDDALCSKKIKRNPVSSKHLSERSARWLSFFVAGVSALVFSLLGFWPFLLGIACLILGFLYSWRGVRLKTMRFVDLVSHSLMLAGLQFLSAYFTFAPRFTGASKWVFPLVFVMAISMYGELFNELRDLEGDLEAGLTHTAAVLGKRVAKWLMMTLFFLGVAAGFVTLFLIGLIQTWVLIAMSVMALLFILPPLFKVKRGKDAIATQEPFQKPLEIACAFALLMQFLAPWASNLLGVQMAMLQQIIPIHLSLF